MRRHAASHWPSHATDGELAVVGRQFAGQDLQERALADPVCPNQPHVLTR
jgi:hypothetical protein